MVDLRSEFSIQEVFRNRVTSVLSQSTFVGTHPWCEESRVRSYRPRPPRSVDRGPELGLTGTDFIRQERRVVGSFFLRVTAYRSPQ